MLPDSDLESSRLALAAVVDRFVSWEIFLQNAAIAAKGRETKTERGNAAADSRGRCVEKFSSLFNDSLAASANLCAAILPD